MNYNKNYFSRKGRTFIPKPVDPGFTIDPSKVEAYKEYCLNNGLIKFPPPIPPTIDGSMEVYDIQQSYTIPSSGYNHNTLDNIVFHYTGKSLVDFDYVLCTISNLSYTVPQSQAYIANIDSGRVTGVYGSSATGLTGFLMYQSETGNTVFIMPNGPAGSSYATISSPGFLYHLGNDDTLDVVIETLIVGKLPENQ